MISCAKIHARGNRRSAAALRTVVGSALRRPWSFLSGARDCDREAYNVAEQLADLDGYATNFADVHDFSVGAVGVEDFALNYLTCASRVPD